MEKLKRKFLNLGERIYFGIKKGSVIERYFKRSGLNLEDPFHLYIDYSEMRASKGLTIYFIYLGGNSLNIVEYVIKKQIAFPVSSHETKVQVAIQKDGKQLQKIKFECLPVNEGSIYLEIS